MAFQAIMASPSEKLADNDFRNWIKAQLAVLLAKDGLVEFVADTFLEFRYRILQDIYSTYFIPVGTICTSCETPNVVQCPSPNTCTRGRMFCPFHSPGNKQIPFRACPNKLCNHIKDRIEKEHIYGKPCWRNTDATKWCTDEIEICKCFLLPASYKSIQQFQELDLNGILTSLLSFRRWCQYEILKEARDATRTVRHSPDLSVSNNDVADFLCIIIKLLKDVDCVTQNRYKSVGLALAKVEKLRSDTLPIAVTDINKVFDDGIKQLTTTVPEEMKQISRETIDEVNEACINTRHLMYEMRDWHEKMLDEQLLLKENICHELKDFSVNLTKECMERFDDGNVEKNETDININIKQAVSDIEISRVRAVEEIRQAGQHQIDIIKSQLASRTDFKETKYSEPFQSKSRDEIPENTDVEQKRYCEESEQETDILKQIYEKVPVTILLETAKTNLPHGDYISPNELDEVIVNSNKQCFSSLLSMKQRTESIRHRPGIEKKRMSTEMGSQILKELHQDIVSRRGIQNKCVVCWDRKKSCIILPCGHFATCLDCLGKQKVCPLCRGAIANIYCYQDVEDEEHNSFADLTERRQEEDIKRQHLWKSTVHSLKNGILPDQRSLNELCAVFGRQSKLVVFTCRKICEQIRMMDENILVAWATYTVKDETNITFVIVVKKNTRLGKAMKYSYIKRVVNEYSLEAKDVLYSNKKALVDQNDLERLRASINKNATELMKRHKFLSVISGSSVRSRNYGIDPVNAVDLVEQPCIVLYVHTKHYIPIDEEPFENLYDGVPVDVMEGEFVPYVLATEHHDNLKHSCQIGSLPDRPPNHNNTRSGSLGCFIDHPEYNLCGLTCAHVLLFPWGMEEVEKDERGTLRWPHFKPHDLVYQPAGSNNVIGQIVQVIYHKGGNESCGMEVALFQIDRRQPISGQFPTMRNSAGDAEMTFSTGKSCGFSHIADDEAIKFGPVSDKTTGKFELETHNTCVKTINEFWDYHTFRIKLNNQLCVKATDTNGQPIPFAREGDSGSLVFKTEENGELVCVGIVEGGTSYGATIVTPIKPILQKIGVQSIKSFEKEKVLGKLIDIENRLERLGNIENRLESRMEGFETKMNQIIQLLTRGQGGSS